MAEIIICRYAGSIPKKLWVFLPGLNLQFVDIFFEYTLDKHDVMWYNICVA
ncbi:MAG: hypothetical protein K6C68_05560 [Ruminococcus sp.]|nr:hypothetical protein [Ruminococcus sp.]